MYLKRKLRTCRNQIQVEKVWFFWKKSIFLIFFYFFALWCRNGKISFYQIFKISKTFFKKVTSMGTVECWKEQNHEIWAHLRHPPWSYEGLFTCVGTKCPFPCRLNRLCLDSSPHSLFGAKTKRGYFFDLILYIFFIQICNAKLQ